MLLCPELRGPSESKADTQARKALLELDGISTIHAVRDMVDTVRYRPDAGAVGPELAAKILLGGIHRGVDAMP